MFVLILTRFYLTTYGILWKNALNMQFYSLLIIPKCNFCILILTDWVLVFHIFEKRHSILPCYFLRGEPMGFFKLAHSTNGKLALRLWGPALGEQLIRITSGISERLLVLEFRAFAKFFQSSVWHLSNSLGKANLNNSTNNQTFTWYWMALLLPLKRLMIVIHSTLVTSLLEPLMVLELDLNLVLSLFLAASFWNQNSWQRMWAIEDIWKWNLLKSVSWQNSWKDIGKFH